jgi:hypothetical protein
MAAPGSTIIGAQLFRRDWRVQVDNLDVSKLHVEFRIVRTLKPEPNKASIVVWNLSKDHMTQLLKRNNPNPGKKLVGIDVEVEAGYQGNRSLIFSGDLREVGSVVEGPDRKTTIAGDDGGRAWRESRINVTFTKGIPVWVILKQCAEAMGVGVGNLGDFIEDLTIPGVGPRIPHTFTMSGSTAENLTRFVHSVRFGDKRLTWSIQSRALQFIVPGEPLNLNPIKLSPSTGLIGSPQSSIDSTVSLGNPQQFDPRRILKNAKQPKPKDPSIIKFKSLLTPGLVPGRLVQLKSDDYDGSFMLMEVAYVGQSAGNDWYCECVGRIPTQSK